jgi:hypothetical protein
MLNFFKRPDAETPSKLVRPVARISPAKPKKSTGLPEPIPVPEVVEGNQDSDWSLWEDSVAFQDSQMPSGFGNTRPPEVKVSTRDKPADDADPAAFDSVRRRAP